jgi:hypothetical protein
MDYKNGRIYKLVSPSGLTYVGSTCQSLAKRKAQHKTDYKKWKKSDIKYMTSFKVLDESFDEVDIVLLEEYRCDSKEKLYARERHWIESLECVNKNVPSRTPSEYRKDNYEKYVAIYKRYCEKHKEEIKARRKEEYNKIRHEKIQYQKEYNDKNKHELSMKRRENVICGCGSTIQKRAEAKHIRSLKHQEWVEVKNIQ